MNSENMNGWVQRLRWAVGASLLLTLAACGSSSGKQGKAYHVVLISLGGAEMPADESSPNLFQFTKLSTSFDGLPSQDGSPLATSATLLTGLTPQQHGAGGGAEGKSILGPEQTPLPEYLIDHGYITGAVIASDCNMPPESGMNQGFGEYQTLPGNATELAVLGEDWIVRHVRQPFFLYVQLPAGTASDQESLTGQADEALGILLRSLGAQGLIDSSLIVVIQGQGPSRRMLIKEPGQRASATGPQAVDWVHLPQLMLEHMALPVAAVRPNSYFTHPLPPVAKDGNP